MESKLTTVPIDEIRESATNPRRHFEEKGLAELTESIKAKGIINPLLLRNVNGHYEIVAGARRYRAARAAGLEELPAIVRPLTDEQAMEIGVIENLQRQDVHPLDEAEGYKRLLDTSKYDVPALAGKVGKSVSYIYQRLALNSLIEPAKKALWKDEITAGHALLLARIQPEDQKELLRYATNNTVRELQREIEREVMCVLDATAFDKKAPLLLEKAGACTTCPKRTGFNKELFNDITIKDRCMDPGCFHAKIEAHLKRVEADAATREVKLLRLSGESYTNSRGLLPKAHVWAESEGWRPAKKGCPEAKPGLICEADGVGRVLDVCIDNGCKVCNPRGRGGPSHSPSSINPTDRYKRRLEIWENKVEQLKRQKVYDKLLPLIEPTVMRDHLVMLIREVEVRNHGAIEDVGKAVGLKIKHDSWRRFKLKDWERDLAKATNKQLSQVLFGMILQQELINDPSMSPGEDACLTTLVGIHGKGKIDMKAIATEARKSLESKKPKPPKKEPKHQKSKKSPKTKKEGKK